MLLNNTKGFLLAEISITIFLVLILLSIMGLILQTYKSSHFAAERTAVTCIAQAKIEQLKTGMTIAIGQEMTMLNAMNYSVKWDTSLVNEAKGEKLYKITVTVTWVVGGYSRSSMFSTYLLGVNNHLIKPRW